MYDSSGLLVRTVAAGYSYGGINAIYASPQPYDPEKGSLILSQGAWSYAYDGKDNGGVFLSNGVYLLKIGSGGSIEAQIQITVSGGVGGVGGLVVVPNPVRAGVESVTIAWQSSAEALELRVYALGGGLVRNLGLQTSPALWDLRTVSGSPVADGMYFIAARVPSDATPQIVKLAVAR